MRPFIRRALVACVVSSLCSLAMASAESAPMVTGTIVDEHGDPVPRVSVKLLVPGSAKALRAVTDAGGRFTISAARGGPAVLEIEAHSFSPVSRSVQVPGSGSVTVDVRLVRSALTERMVVTGVVGEDIERVPGGVAVVPREEIQHSLAHNLEDVVAFVPGVVAQSRFGADETQLSIRGSGLRNNFHNRGTNLLINGIPYQDADGFGDFESLDLLAMERLEIWKGANALRFGGNTLGGAINFVTNDGDTASPWSAIGEGGSYGLDKVQGAVSGLAGPVGFHVSASHTGLDGYRDHSAQDRDRVFASAKWAIGPDTAMVADVSWANVDEELPGALTRAEMEEDPRQAGPEQAAQDWGRHYDFGRVALGVLRTLGEGTDVGVSVYGQHRDMVHPIFQVLDQEQRTLGGEVRYQRERPESFLRRMITGISVQDGSTDERRYENAGGVSGDLTAEFEATARNYGAYFEGELGLSPSLALILGVRADQAVRIFDDRFLSDGDRSDERTFSGVSPKVGVLWAMGPDAQLFGNVSRAIEPPLLLEMTSFGAPEFLPLDAQEALQAEVGSRGHHGRVGWDASVYYSEIRNEIVNTNVQPFPGAPFTIPSYRNVDRTEHAGLELGGEIVLADLAGRGRLSWRTAYTLSRFRFDGDPEFGDNDLPGAPRHLIRSEVRFQGTGGFWIAPAVDWSPSSYFVDSANTATNDAYAVLGVRGGYDWPHVSLFLEAANVTDRVYSASVVVDDALGRFYEPANGRAFYGGLRWRSGSAR